MSVIADSFSAKFTNQSYFLDILLWSHGQTVINFILHINWFEPFFVTLYLNNAVAAVHNIICQRLLITDNTIIHLNLKVHPAAT